MMHTMKLSCVGQTFALAKCSDFREKKSRSRKSKEERKALAESFIKRYQGSNNGNFPSLNLTHKEVGGSFYTVREIVREIIQENKVLRPGSPTSKVLNLVDCLQNQEAESFSLDTASHLSISTIGHLIDQRQMEVDSLSEDHKILREGCEMLKSDVEEVFTSRPNENSELMQGKPYHLERSFCNESVTSGYFVDVGHNEADLSKSTRKTHDNSAICKEVHTEVIGHSSVECETGEVEQPDPLYQPVSIISTPYGLVVNDNDTQSKSNNVVGLRNSIEKSSADSMVTRADTSPETKALNCSSTIIIANQLQDQQESYPIEVFPLPSMITKTCDREEIFLETEGSTSSGEVLRENNSLKEGQVNSALVEEVSIKNRTETAEIDSFPIDEEAMTILTHLPSEISKNESRTAPCSENFMRTITDIKSPGESLSSDAHATPEPAVKAEHEGLHNVGMSGTDNNSTRILQQKSGKEPVAQENNPFWTAVKTFLTTFIKFWTE